MPPKRKQTAAPRRVPSPPKVAPDALPEARARAAVAREEAAPGSGDKVRMTFRVVLARKDAEALSAWAIREERNIEGVVTDILERAVRQGSAG